MTDITAFIRDRLAEEQSAAEGARDDSGRWFASRVGPDQGHGSNVAELREHNGSVDREYTRITDPVYAPQVDHMVLHDPARVLAQVAAMRAIVEFHESWPVLAETEPEMVTDTDDIGNMTVKMAKQVAWMTEREYRERFGTEPPTAPMLRHLAAIWRDHEDYDPAWAPEGE